jgi:amino acid transporter
MLLALVNIGSSTAFNATVSLAVVGLYFSYLIPLVLMVIRRLKGIPLAPSPFSLGKAGLPLNLCAIIYTIFTMIFLFFPPYQPVTPQNMNYACLVFGSVVLFGLVWWALKGKKVFIGPKHRIQGVSVN